MVCSRITKVDNNGVISAIGAVIRGCPTRAESKNIDKNTLHYFLPKKIVRLKEESINRETC